MVIFQTGSVWEVGFLTIKAMVFKILSSDRTCFVVYRCESVLMSPKGRNYGGKR